MAKKDLIGEKFEQDANPNNKGISKDIDVINNTDKDLNVNNGSNYSRQNSYLYKKYYLIKTYEKGTIDTKVDNYKNTGIGKGKLLTIKLNGFKND